MCFITVISALATLLVLAQAQCTYPTPFYIQIGPNANEVACRPCNPTLRSSLRGGVGRCECAAGEYCTSYGDDNPVRSAVYGTCRAYTLLDAPCGVPNDCRTTALNYLGQTVTDEQLTCVDGFCRECSAALWPTLTSQEGSGLVYTCPGDLQSARPGEQRECLSNSTMWRGGSLDYSYGASASTSTSNTPTRSRNANATPSSTPSLTRTPTGSLSVGASPSVSPSVGADSITSDTSALLPLWIAGALCVAMM